MGSDPAQEGIGVQRADMTGIRFPIKTPRLTIRPMRLDDAEALPAVYGDVETMQHLNSELRPPSTRYEWVQTKIDLFERDDQLSLWTVIHAESGQIVDQDRPLTIRPMRLDDAEGCWRSTAMSRRCSI